MKSQSWSPSALTSANYETMNRVQLQWKRSKADSSWFGLWILQSDIAAELASYYRQALQGCCNLWWEWRHLGSRHGLPIRVVGDFLPTSYGTSSKANVWIDTFPGSSRYPHRCIGNRDVAHVLRPALSFENRICSEVHASKGIEVAIPLLFTSS